jgi:hypothetical protein
MTKKNHREIVKDTLLTQTTFFYLDNFNKKLLATHVTIMCCLLDLFYLSKKKL